MRSSPSRAARPHTYLISKLAREHEFDFQKRPAPFLGGPAPSKALAGRHDRARARPRRSWTRR